MYYKWIKNNNTYNTGVTIKLTQKMQTAKLSIIHLAQIKVKHSFAIIICEYTKVNDLVNNEPTLAFIRKYVLHNNTGYLFGCMNQNS